MVKEGQTAHEIDLKEKADQKKIENQEFIFEIGKQSRLDVFIGTISERALEPRTIVLFKLYQGEKRCQINWTDSMPSNMFRDAKQDPRNKNTLCP